MAWRLFPSMWPMWHSNAAQSNEWRNEATSAEPAQDPVRVDGHAATEQRRSRPA